MSKNTGTSELINYFDLGANGDVGIAGSLDVNTIANADSDTDKFLVSDTGIIKYRTGSQLLTDIGAQGLLTNPVTGTGTSGTIPVFTGSTTIGNSIIQSNATQVNVVGYGSQLLFDSLGSTKNGGIQYVNDFELLVYNSRGTGSSITLGNENLDFNTNTSGNPRLRITDGGNVLIGKETDNGSKFQVNSSDSSAFRISRTGSSDYGFEIGGTTFGLYDYTNSFYRWRTNGNNLLLAESNGNVGIGTESPASKLQLNSNLDSTGYTTAAALSVGENLKLYQFINNNTSTDSNGESGILLGQVFGDVAQWGISVKRTGSFVGDLIFRTRTASATSAERMRITSAGNVLVGTTTEAGFKLDVNGTGRFSGELGIGIAPSQQLTIGGQASAQMTLRSSTTTGSSEIYFGDSAAVYRGYIGYQHDGDYFQFATAASVKLTIASTGAATFSSSVKSSVSSGGSVITSESTATNGEGQFVIIGKNSSGTTRSASFKYDNSDIIRFGTPSNIDMRFETNDSPRMRITSGGNVLIGTETDSGYKLYVSGNTYLDGAIEGATFSSTAGALTINANTQFKSGFYRWNDTSTNLPEAGFFAVVIYGNCGNVVAQMATHFTNANTYVRSYNSSWTAWRRII